MLAQYLFQIKENGMVIMDECHHAATATVIEILQAMKAEYVYGVTATPTRSDGLEKIAYMLTENVLHLDRRKKFSYNEN